MIVGIVFGLVIGLFGLFWLFAYDYFRTTTIVCLIILSFIIPTVIGAIIGIYEDNNYYLQYIAEYEEKKEIYEQSINNKNLSDLEKINLVSNISFLNSELAKKKIEYKKWYYKVDYSLIEKLKPISSEILVGDTNVKV